MVSRLIKCALLCTVLTGSFASLAADKWDDYDADYLMDEGRLLFKVRGYYMAVNGKQSGFPAPTIVNPQPVPNLTKLGFGIDTASTIFFSDHIGVEASLGLQMYKIRTQSINTVAQNYGGSGGAKGRHLYSIPFSASLQYHIAPFGGIRPYVGAGYHFAFNLDHKVKSRFKVNNGHGPLLQAGVDFVAKDDTLFTFDVRQYIQKTKITYRDGFVGNVPGGVKPKVKFNPLLISVGIGFKF